MLLFHLAQRGHTNLMKRDVPFEGMDVESQTPSAHLPQRGNAYQSRATPWEPDPRVCGEGTPHRVGVVDVRDTQAMRRSFRTRVSLSGWIPRVCTLGWYAMPLQGMGSGTWFGGPEIGSVIW